MAVTRQYKDVALDFIVHPNTKDLVYLKNDQDIKRAVKNIVLTNLYERHFDDTFGGNLISQLFEDVSVYTSIMIQDTIETTLKFNEPRADVIEVRVLPEEDQNGYNVTITFQILNQLNPLTVNFFLERLR